MQKPINPWEYIQSDAYRYGGKYSVRDIMIEYARHPGFRYSFWLRLRRSRNVFLRAISVVFLRSISVRYNIQIPWVVDIGYGLYIGHNGCVVVSSSAKIGNNCNLSQFVTIGTHAPANAATIGDCVYVGPSVCIVGEINVGSMATIGAGAVVVKDVPEAATVAGNPARPTGSGKPGGRFIQNPWPPSL
ncbi:serine acetyltransferase [Devosia sp.]|uniref:serine acetyltransferase n=1 Tax=Devosia sp. TaxID=1871048 RepID=UPI003F70D4EA